MFFPSFWMPSKVILTGWGGGGGGGGVLVGQDPENKFAINKLIWSLVLIMVPMILVKIRNFKLLPFLLLEIWRHKISFPEWNKSSRFDIYPLQSSKTRVKSFFMIENIFSGTNLSSLHFHDLKRNKRIRLFNFSRRLISKTKAATPAGSILLKFCQNVSNW